MPESQIKIFNFKNDLKIIISSFFYDFHSSIGGCRMQSYPSIHEAINDCYDLSYAMAIKAYYLGISYGGSKCVVYNPQNIPFSEIAPSLGDAINQLDGRYIASIDLGIGLNEIEILSKFTPHIYGTKKHKDPSKSTAKGVIESIKYLTKSLNKTNNDITILIQGLGKVGSIVTQFCLDNHYKVIGSDIDIQKVETFQNKTNFTYVEPSKIFSKPSDIFIPAASGNIINEKNVEQLNTKYICSIANNPLKDPNKLSKILHENNIIFIPDFITSAGGLLMVANELEKDENKIIDINCIPQTIKDLMKRFKDQNFYNKAIELFKEGK